MIKVSKLADYAVVVLATLARNESGLMTAPAISGATGLPEPTVAKVLKLLAKDNILQSLRGATGGYRLCRTPEQISIAKIISAVDGPISLTACVEDSSETCGYAGRCAVKGRWNGVNYAIREALENVTLADMINNDRHARDVSVVTLAKTEGGVGITS